MFKNKKYLNYLAIVQDTSIEGDQIEAANFLRDNSHLLVPLLKKNKLLPSDLHWAIIYIVSCRQFFQEKILSIKDQLPSKYHQAIQDLSDHLSKPTIFDLEDIE